jgi:hypothetical protein
MSLDPALELAAKSLQLVDVILKSIRADLGPASDVVEALQQENLLLQIKRPNCESVTSYQAEGTESTKALHAFAIEAGVRLLSRRESSESAPINLADSIVGTIECTFIATFRDESISNVQLTPEQLEKFGEHNAAFHVWPYWREVVQSAASRMGLPRLILPPFRLQKSATSDVKT